MQVEVPIFRQISRDLKLPPRAFQVWRSAIELLDLVEWRELKLATIENDLEVDPSTVSRSLATLVERGYLCKLSESGAPARFRVPFSRADCTATSPTDRDAEVSATTLVAVRRTRARIVSNGVV
jgi:hypothetical protein